MKKHYVLVSVEDLSAPDHVSRELWKSFLHDIARIPKLAEGSARIGPNCWLLDRENDVSSLVNIAATADANKLTYAVRYLAEGD